MVACHRDPKTGVAGPAKEAYESFAGYRRRGPIQGNAEAAAAALVDVKNKDKV